MPFAMKRADDQGFSHENQGPTIIGVTLAVTITALITTLTRVYVRTRMIRNVGWDDYVMILAMLLCISGQVLIIPEVYLGAGRHKENIDPTFFTRAFKLNFITQPIYLYAICLVKISIGFFLLRIAVAAVYRRTIIAIMTFMGVYTTACFFTIVLQCDNLAVQWDPTVKGTCWSRNIMKNLSFINVSINILTDLLFSIVIPIPLLWNLQMNKRQKSSLMCIFSLGIFATAAAVIRLTFLPNYGKTGDWLWDSRNLTIWSVVESNVGIIAGNLPCLKPIFRAALGSTYGHGSCKSTDPRYMSRPYGAGTSGHSINPYNSLGSGKTRNSDSQQVNGVKESYTLTTINAENNARSGADTSKSDTESMWKTSQESITRLHERGGIKATTEVNIVESSYLADHYGEGISPEQKETHIV